MLLWWYLGAGGVQMGPFSATHLQQFASSGICQQDQLVCHGPSAVWLPLWLALQLVSTGQDAPAQPMPAQRTQQQAAPAGQQPTAPQLPPPAATALRAATASPQQRDTAGSSAGQRTAVSSLKQPHSDDDNDYGGYGVSSDWLKKVKAVEAATKARQQQEKQQQAKQQELKQQHQQQQQQQEQKQQGQNSWQDTEMEDASAEAVLAAVSLVRGDQQYLDDLHRAIDMDWEQPKNTHGSDVQAAGATAAGQPVAAAAAAAAAVGTMASTEPCSAVDLAAIAAAGSAAAAEGAARSSSAALLVLVLDTNVLLERKCLGSLQQVQRVQQQQGGQILLPAAQDSSSGGSLGGGLAAVRLRVVIPWTVLVELDRLKLRGGAVESGARAAVESLRSELVAPTQGSSGSSMFVLQSVQDFRQAAQEFDFGVTANSLVGDDRILQCALSQQQQLYSQRPDQQGDLSAARAHAGVLLLSNDKVMQLKAQANGVAVAGLSDLQLNHMHTQALHAGLARMLQRAGVAAPWPAAAAATISTDTSPIASALDAAAGDPALAHVSGRRSSTSMCMSSDGGSANGLQHQQEEQQRRQAAAERRQQEEQHWQQQQQQQQQQAAAKQHMQTRPAGQQHQQQQLSVADLRAAASSFLTFLRLTLASHVEGWFVEDLGEFGLDVMKHKPPWNNLQFLEVLDKHFDSTVKTHLASGCQGGTTRSLVSYLQDMAKRINRQQFQGVELPKLPFNLGVRVMEVLTAFGAQEAAQQVQAALTAAAASSSSDQDSGSAAAGVPSMQACVDAAATGTAAGFGGSETAAAVPPPPPRAAPAAAAAAAADSDAHTHIHHRQQPQQPQQHPNDAAAVLAVLAAAAAAVPAPQPVGCSCLTLCQLLVYAATLLQAVLPLLGQALAEAAAAGAQQGATAAVSGSVTAGVAYEQRLQAVVKLLGQLGQHMDQQQHWDQQQQQQWQAVLRTEVLDTGLQLVELCSCLLNNEAARAAVSQQLMAHADEFVHQAAGYLLVNGQHHPQQQHQDQLPRPAVLLQQLTQALQHLQHLLLAHAVADEMD